MRKLLVFIIISILFLSFLAFMTIQIQENYNSYKVSKIGQMSELFPRKSKAIKTKLPVDRDSITEVQNVDNDIIIYENN